MSIVPGTQFIGFNPTANLNDNKMKLTEQSKGLGDTIEKITTITGVKKVVDTVSNALNVDCGCEKRRDTLNRIFPYKQKSKK